MLKSSNSENDFVSNPPKEPIILEKPHAVGDKVSFTMPWMGGRDVYVAAKIEAIEAPNALLTFIGFFDSEGETGLEPLANLHPWNAESQADLDSFTKDDDQRPAGCVSSDDIMNVLKK